MGFDREKLYKDFILKFVEINSKEYIDDKLSNYIRDNKELQNDTDLLKDMVKINPMFIRDIKNEEILNDRELALNLIKRSEKESKSCYSIIYFSEKVKSDKEIQDLILKSDLPNSYILKSMPKEIFEDKELFLILMNRSDYMELKELFPEDFYNDKDLLLELNKENLIGLYPELSNDIQLDKDIVNKLISPEINIKIFSMFPAKLRADKETVLRSFENGLSFIRKTDFNIISSKLRDDKDFLISLMKIDPDNIEFISDKFRNDKEVVSLAIKENPKLFKYASKSLKNDKEFILENLEYTGTILKETNYQLRSDTDIQNKHNELINDRELALEKVKESGFNLQYFSDDIKDDEEIVFNAISNYGYYLSFASNRLQEKFGNKDIGEIERDLINPDYKNIILKDSLSPYGGISYNTETLEDFIIENNLIFSNHEKINKSLEEFGIEKIDFSKYKEKTFNDISTRERDIKGRSR